MRFFSFLLPILLFLGCSNKINLADYRPAYIPKNTAAPSNFSPKIKKISIVRFPKYNFRGLKLDETATYKLNSLLQTSKFVKIIRIINNNQINEEIKAAEISKETNSDLGADYLIKGTILNISYVPRYHRGFYYFIKNKNGQKIRKYSPPYYSYEVCSQINIQIFQLPDLKNIYDRIFQSCVHYRDDSSFRRFYSNLVFKSINKTVTNAFNSLKKFFAPKGYIYEVRKNGDDLIAKISLGKNQGMYEGLKLNIYALSKDPVNGDIEKYKIGEGEVSNLIFDNSCWIIVDLEDNAQLKIGDMVEPNFETSFWDLF
ncbi:putative lipoprotein [Nautilia profundicola AmH]|uniref:Lipoprotein n=1 Tax=Nautilia profundicola (strain ATCC BAA-1463 / DSM 18972 / AmH) TaxID=598659 RepID=B9L756_NAUPA|nr:hypothetical protein [Nautilia profundicola]ACM93248.1 putative lipoprotein [Nautilia profundicola AmH]